MIDGAVALALGVVGLLALVVLPPPHPAADITAAATAKIHWLTKNPRGTRKKHFSFNFCRVWACSDAECLNSDWSRYLVIEFDTASWMLPTQFRAA